MSTETRENEINYVFSADIACLFACFLGSNNLGHKHPLFCNKQDLMCLGKDTLNIKGSLIRRIGDLAPVAQK